MGTTYLTDGDDLASVANAIRAKSGGSSQLAFPAGFVSEIQAIPSGGGGQEYTGYVEVTDTETQILTIPVDVSQAEHFEVYAFADRTGTVSGGVVAYDEEPTIPSITATNKAFVWYYTSTESYPEKNMKRNSTDYATQNRPANAHYCQSYYNSNGSTIDLKFEVVSGSNIVLSTGNAGRKFCYSGCYVRFAYKVIVF